VDEREIQRRLGEWQPHPPKYTQGYRALWMDQVTQAPDGCDFKFCIEKDWLTKRTSR
jgi:dihydroxy-acid dehydratase